MAVTLTTGDISSMEPNASQARLESVLAASKMQIERYAPAAPEQIQNEAAYRLINFILLSQDGGGVIRSMKLGDGEVQYVTNLSPSLRNSGAESILSPYKRRRAGLIPGRI